MFTVKRIIQPGDFFTFADPELDCFLNNKADQERTNNGQSDGCSYARQLDHKLVQYGPSLLSGCGRGAAHPAIANEESQKRGF